MSTNKPMFGPVVLEIFSSVFINSDILFPLKHKAGIKSVKN